MPLWVLQLALCLEIRRPLDARNIHGNLFELRGIPNLFEEGKYETAQRLPRSCLAGLSCLWIDHPDLVEQTSILLN
jgi:hypothetical protein